MDAERSELVEREGPVGEALQAGLDAVEFARRRITAYDATDRDMVDGARGLADSPESGSSEDFAALVLAVIGSGATTPLRLPIGDDVYGHLDEDQRTCLAEFAAARAAALIQSPPTH
ncbi:hypothetical protein OV450_0114 [Actinobacteria bacterium OV450]|nr:hypothetical protein OV450_0114 [Actinobacteria bacterium OV450]